MATYQETATRNSDSDGQYDDASAPVFSKGRDLEQTRDVLATWLAGRLQGATEIQVDQLTYPVGSGLSNETILFQARYRANGHVRVEQLVLRIHPGASQVYLEPGFRNQFDLLRALHVDARVRVPEVLWFEADCDVLGHEFFVMRRIFGRVPISKPVYNAGGWLFDATPAQRRRAWTSAMEQLCQIHLVPLDPISFLDKPALGQRPLEQQLNYWEQALPWSTAGQPSKQAQETLRWLRENVPVEQAPSLSWGDARIGNMMFDDNFDVVAVVDWEQVSLAGPMQDLAWWLQFDVHHSTRQGVPRLDGLGTRQETIDFWEETVGRPVYDLEWHEVWAAFKLKVIGERVSRIGGAHGLEAPPTLVAEESIRPIGLTLGSANA
jgi:aminoglycoside phosphotransferase (APT) family kinase protein